MTEAIYLEVKEMAETAHARKDRRDIWNYPYLTLCSDHALAPIRQNAGFLSPEC